MSQEPEDRHSGEPTSQTTPAPKLTPPDFSGDRREVDARLPFRVTGVIHLLLSGAVAILLGLQSLYDSIYTDVQATLGLGIFTILVFILTGTMSFFVPSSRIASTREACLMKFFLALSLFSLIDTIYLLVTVAVITAKDLELELETKANRLDVDLRFTRIGLYQLLNTVAAVLFCSKLLVASHRRSRHARHHNNGTTLNGNKTRTTSNNNVEDDVSYNIQEDGWFYSSSDISLSPEKLNKPIRSMYTLPMSMYEVRLGCVSAWIQLAIGAVVTSLGALHIWLGSAVGLPVTISPIISGTLVGI